MHTFYTLQVASLPRTPQQTHLMHHPVDQAKQPPAHEVYLLGLP